uniref:Phosphorylated adapter RNA export protein n=1 Tax=Biomphalaria glabrata TaxID=6526 RepID=A0A2C9LGF1_BIOGL
MLVLSAACRLLFPSTQKISKTKMDNDIEDGECTDSDSDGIFHQEPSPAPVNLYSNKPGYRPQIPQIKINSDNSSSDDDDLSDLKRSRSFHTENHASDSNVKEVPFINPLLSNDSSDFKPCNYKRRKNNVWGSVITEQVLSQDLKTFSVYKSDRNVETYDYTKAKEDLRPTVEPMPDDVKDDIFADVEVEKEDTLRSEYGSRKRKNHFYKKKTVKLNKLVKLEETAGVSIQELVSSITSNLSEPKLDLFTRIVETIGCGEALRLYNLTVDVEEEGGMFTNDGFRRRTPGGVFIQLLKSDASIPEEKVKPIFEKDELEWKQILREKRKIKKAARNRWKKQQKKKLKVERADSPGEELEALNSIDSNTECDVSDVIERPSTPEPKDDSSDEVDEEEEEDIATAIQKAKEAIMRKQAKLSQEQMETQLKCVSIEQDMKD